MRVVHYYPRAIVGDGGPTQAVRGWAKALVDAGCSVRVVCSEGSPSEPSPIDWRVIRHSGTRRWLRPRALNEHLGDADLLVLHSAWVFHNVVAGRAAVRVGLPYVVTPHGGYDRHIVRRRALAKQGWWWTFERRLLSHAAGVHVFFESEEEAVRELGYRGGFVVAPHGVDVPHGHRWDGGSGGYVLWLGRYDVEHKGLDLLVEALASIPVTQRPSVRLHGPDSRGGRSVVGRLVASRGLERWVSLGGPLHGEAKMRALEAARAFVYPSRWDSHSIAVTEAMALGVPCVVTDVMHVGRETGREGAAFVAGTTPPELGDALAAATGSVAAGVGQRARRFARTRFDWSNSAASFLEQVEHLLGQKTPQPR